MHNNFQITQAIGTKLGVILSHYEPLLHNKYQLFRQFMKGAFGGMKKRPNLKKKLIKSIPEYLSCIHQKWP